MVRWDAERLRNAFIRDASLAATVLDTRLREPLMAIEAMRGVFIASGTSAATRCAAPARLRLSAGRLAAIGWYEAMERAQVPAFEAVRNEGLTQFRVFERSENAASTPREPVIAMRFVEPMRGNASALGLNVLSIPAARRHRAQPGRGGLGGQCALRADADSEGQDRTGVVVYRAAATAKAR